MIRPLLIASATLALLLAAPVMAADEVAEARAHFDQGARLYRAGKYRDAIVQFEAAYRIKPHGAIHYNVAQCWEKLEQWPEALLGYQDYLREVADARDRAAVRATMGRIERRLAAAGVQALLVYTDPPGAAVRIDGKPRGRTPYHVTLSPGSYRVALTLDGYTPEEQEVEVNMTGTRLVDVVLQSRAAARASTGAPAAASTGTAAPAATQPPTVTGTAASSSTSSKSQPDLSAKPATEPALAVAPPGPAPSLPPPVRPRILTWVAAGVAVAAGAAGVASGVAASRQSETLRDGQYHADAASIARGARSKATTANVLYAVSGAAAAAGVTLYFIEGKF